MPHDEEHEIRLQFLEESREFLDSIEAVLLDLASADGQQLNAALRAAHSLKGGAGMMGFDALSNLSHRLEDFFKVLKTSNEVERDTELESLFLGAVDCLRQVSAFYRQGATVESAWLEAVAHPIFEQLYQRLGEPQAEDEASLLSEEVGSDMAAILFESEVEGLLERLERVLATPAQYCLQEEVKIVAQELIGLGQMLQLDSFITLCGDIEAHIVATPDQAEAIARAALEIWRRSQALVMVGQKGALPSQFLLPDESSSQTAVADDLTIPLAMPAPLTSAWLDTETDPLDLSESFADLDLSEFEADAPPTEIHLQVEALTSVDLDADFVPTALLSAGAEPSTFLHSDTESELEALTDEQLADEISLDRGDELSSLTLAADSPVAELEAEPLADTSDVEGLEADLFETEIGTLDLAALQEEIAHLDVSLPPTEVPAPVPTPTTAAVAPLSTPAPVAPKVVAPQPAAPAAARTEAEESTVRVPVRQLEQLSDLFGELVIERNALNLQLGRLRDFVGALRNRVRELEQSNSKLRTVYDKAATEIGLSAAQGNGSTDTTRLKQQDVPIALPLDGLATRRSEFDILEMDQYGDLHLLSQEQMESIVQIQEVTDDIAFSLQDADRTAGELNRVAKQLQVNVMQARMRPLADLVSRFPRAVRDLCVRYGKQVDLKIYGSSTPIDRFILEALGDPLMHLIRNAFDHGIEDPQMRQQAGKPLQGTIEIRAVHRGNQTLISVSDDGGGINLDKIRDRARKMGLSPTQLDAASGTELLDLIFEPGFSTADRVTDLSGRGVGMDVVRTNLRDIRGDVRVETVLGQGTTFTLSFPFTLSILRVLLVESGGMLLALPSDGIEEMLLVKPESIYATAAQEVLDWEGTMVPLVRLEQGLTFHCPHSSFVSDSTPTIDAPTAFVISRGADLAALQVDRFWGEQEVAIRPVEAAIALPPGFAGCTILGDGRVVPLADTAKLLDWMTNRSLPVGSSPLGNSFDLASLGASDDGSTATTQYRQAAILIVDDSINVRRFLALTLEKAGYRVEQARDGQDAVEKLVGGLAVQAVICDIEMPRLDGFGVLARIKSDPAFRELPIAMLTSRSGAKHRQLANSLGAAAYFSKPYNEQELLSTLKTLIRQPSLSPIS